MKSLRTLTCGALIIFFTFAAECQGQEQKSMGKGIDPATVAAYETLGATYGGVVRGRFGYHFIVGPESAQRNLPAFQFKTYLDAKLLDASVPFGLLFEGMNRKMLDLD